MFEKHIKVQSGIIIKPSFYQCFFCSFVFLSQTVGYFKLRFKPKEGKHMVLGLIAEKIIDKHQVML